MSSFFPAQRDLRHALQLGQFSPISFADFAFVCVKKWVATTKICGFIYGPITTYFLNAPDLRTTLINCVVDIFWCGIAVHLHLYASWPVRANSKKETKTSYMIPGLSVYIAAAIPFAFVLLFQRTLGLLLSYLDELWRNNRNRNDWRGGQKWPRNVLLLMSISLSGGGIFPGINVIRYPFHR